MKEMRVALVSEHASPLAVLGGTDAGGQNVHVAELARHLGALGAHVTVYTRREDPALAARVPFSPNVVVHHVDAGPAEPLPKDSLLPFMPAFAEQLEAIWSCEPPPAVVHSHFWMSGIAARRATSSFGIPLAHTFHARGSVKRRFQGVADTSPDERIALEAQLARAVDLVIATSYDECHELAGFGVEPESIALVPCGVDLRLFRPTGPVEARPPGRTRVVVVSRLVERKGIGDVIDAVAQLPDVELVIAGGPPTGLLEGDPVAAAFMARAEELGCADRVEFRGSVDRPQVAALLRSADVVCCCPWYEPFGIVAVEAMACGVPVLVSHVGGLAESVLDGITGVHVPSRDPEAIAGAIRMLAADPALRRRLGAQGAMRSRRYNWRRVAAATLAKLEELSTRSPSLSFVAESERQEGALR
jgi:glycosyltransferase involved in cell wall biosynthesis